MKIHHCLDMPGGYLYRCLDGVWCLYKEDIRCSVEQKVCKFCRIGLGANNDYYVARDLPHRCLAMIQVEERRNHEKARHTGDRSYDIKWDAYDGWSLHNKGEKVLARRNLERCPFCKTNFPLLNQVVIE